MAVRRLIRQQSPTPADLPETAYLDEALAVLRDTIRKDTGLEELVIHAAVISPRHLVRKQAKSCLFHVGRNGSESTLARMAGSPPALTNRDQVMSFFLSRMALDFETALANLKAVTPAYPAQARRILQEYLSVPVVREYRGIHPLYELAEQKMWQFAASFALPVVTVAALIVSLLAAGAGPWILHTMLGFLTAAILTASAETGVHIWATRIAPAFDLFGSERRHMPLKKQWLLLAWGALAGTGAGLLLA